MGKMYKAQDGNYEDNDAAQYIVLPHVAIHTHEHHHHRHYEKDQNPTHKPHIHTVETISLACWKLNELAISYEVTW